MYMLKIFGGHVTFRGGATVKVKNAYEVQLSFTIFVVPMFIIYRSFTGTQKSVAFSIL